MNFKGKDKGFSFSKAMVQVVWAIATLGFSAMTPAKAETVFQKEMVQTTEAIFSLFAYQYAPRQWKKEHFSWDVEQERQKLVEKILEDPQMTVKKFHRLLSRTFNKLHDYHVFIELVTQEKASLPFRVKPAEGRYFVVEALASDSTFPFEVGDELVLFNGKAVKEVVKELLEQSSGAPDSATEKMLASFQLTSRVAAYGDLVPRGPVSLAFRKKGETQLTYFHTVWQYTPDTVKFPSFFEPLGTLLEKERLEKTSVLQRLRRKMVSKKAKARKAESESSEEPLLSHAEGARKSFLPKMGKIVSQDPHHKFYNYIFEHKGKKIGYLRINTYDYSPKEEDLTERALAFQKLINEYEVKTDLLVIDQIHNPGGSVHYVYALASMLSDQPLKTPKHRKSLSLRDISEMNKDLKNIEGLKTDKDVRDYFEGQEYFDGLPINLNFLNFWKESMLFDIAQWNAGKTLTDPTYVDVDVLQPHPRGVYTKPIIVLVDELSFSAADFFPAILQDNKRALIFGTQTAGAGGYIVEESFPRNHFGVVSVNYTGSFAIRASQKPIESLGITPDVKYSLTADDYQNHFRGYQKALLEAIDQKLEL